MIASRFLVLCLAFLAAMMVSADNIQIFSTTTCDAGTVMGTGNANTKGDCNTGDGTSLKIACGGGQTVIQTFSDNQCSSIIGGGSGTEGSCIAVTTSNGGVTTRLGYKVDCNSAASNAASASLMVALIAVVSMVFFS